MIGRLPAHAQHLLLAALCAGIASANAVRVQAAIAPSLAIGLAVIAAALPRARFALLAIGLALAGSSWGALRLEAIDRSPMSAEIGHAAVARVTVTGPARRTQFALRIPGRIERFGDRDVREPVLLQLPVGRSPPQGAILKLPVLVAEPRSGKDGFDERTWLRRRGVHVVLRGRDPEVVGRRRGLGGVADRLRSAIGTALASGVSGERRAVLLGIVLGEDEGLDQDLGMPSGHQGSTTCLRSPGQNVALVAGGVLLVAWLLGIPRMTGQVGALVAIGAYVLAVGAQPSVVRAGVAGGLASLAWMCARERDRWWFLLLGALVLLAWNPYNLLDPGFQLSFAAVAAIFTLVPRLMGRLEGYPLPRTAAAVVAVSIACGSQRRRSSSSSSARCPRTR